MMQVVGVVLILIGLYGLVTTKHIIRLLLALNVLELGVNILIVSLGYITNGQVPIYTAQTINKATHFVDPLPQAMVLTSIVIGFAITALGLAFARQFYLRYGTFDLSVTGGEN